MLLLLKIFFIFFILCMSKCSCQKSHQVIESSSNGNNSSSFYHYALAYDNVLPKHIFDNLYDECISISKYALVDFEVEQLKGKKATNWLSTEPYSYVHGVKKFAKARFYIEKSIFMLKKYVQNHIEFLPKHIEFADLKGAEWWVQVKGGGEDIAFHYDKDESLATKQQFMKHPSFSTILYITNIGAPTVIFNMTTVDGTTEVPVIPEQGYISYPKANRFVIFRGDLHHGVVGSAASRTSATSSKKRVTLLMNWWINKPDEPNTRYLTDLEAGPSGFNVFTDSVVEADMDITNELDIIAEAVTGVTGESSVAARRKRKQRHNKAYKSEVVEDLTPRGITPSDVESMQQNASKYYNLDHKAPVVSLVIPIKEETRRHQLDFPPGDLQFINLPLNLQQELYYVQWKTNETYGNIGMLDLFKEQQVNQMLQVKEPKMLYLYHPEDKKSYQLVLTSVLPIAKKYVGQMKFYFCPFNICGDATKAFGLSPSELPRFVIEDSVNQSKYVQSMHAYDTSSKSIEEFLVSSIFQK